MKGFDAIASQLDSIKTVNALGRTGVRSSDGVLSMFLKDDELTFKVNTENGQEFSLTRWSEIKQLGTKEKQKAYRDLYGVNGDGEDKTLHLDAYVNKCINWLAKGNAKQVLDGVAWSQITFHSNGKQMRILNGEDTVKVLHLADGAGIRASSGVVYE